MNIREAFAVVLLLFYYSRAAGNEMSNQHGVTWQLCGLAPRAARAQLGTAALPQYTSVAPHSCESNGRGKVKELKTTLLFQSGPLSLVFLLCAYLLSSNNSCLSSLPQPFTASPHRTTPFYFSGRRLVMESWRCLAPLPTSIFWSQTSGSSPAPKPPCGGTQIWVSVLAVVHARAFSQTLLSPK